MESQPSPRIDPELFRQHGSEVLTFLTRHFTRLGSLEVKPQLEPGQLAAQFTREAPLLPQEFGQLLQELQVKIMPGVTHWQHPRFFSYYPAASSLPAILSELIISALGAVGLQWSANPIGTELECVVMDWIARMIQIPEDSPFLHRSGIGGGLIQNTAGDALAAIMVAARVHKHLLLAGHQSMSELSVEEREALYYCDSSALVVYMSDQTHFSGPKAARVAGLRRRLLKAERLPEGNYGLTARQVLVAMEEDRRQGLIPCAVQLNFGSTNTCGYDDIASFAGFAEEHEVWVHVDAAYAGASLILPQFQQRALAIQSAATSFNFNGSKWFLCGFDSAFLYVRNRQLLSDVFAASGAYLDKVQAEDVYNPEFKDWAVPLGRRFRALRVWMVIEYFGIQGLQNFLQQAIAQGDWLRQQIRASPDFALVVETDLGLVCFRLRREPEQKTAALIEHLQQLEAAGGPFLVYPSELEGMPIVRVALGGSNTSFADVEVFWTACQQWKA